jgi:hypothetical protein
MEGWLKRADDSLNDIEDGATEKICNVLYALRRRFEELLGNKAEDSGRRPAR